MFDSSKFFWIIIFINLKKLAVYIKYKDPIITLEKLQKIFLQDFVAISAI